MGLQTVTLSKTTTGRNTLPHLSADAEEFFPHAHVPILDDDLLEDEYFEPDGVNDFVRDFEAWDPDKEF
jgi:hypothetical protein